MSDRILLFLSFTSALGAGLVAGLLFIFSVCIMTALGRLPAPQGVAAMQQINLAIINPWFLAAFMGTAAASLILAVAALAQWQAPGSAWLLAACLFYLVGTFGITMTFNVPLNNGLAAAAAGSSSTEALWTRYLSVWTAWNHLRSAAAVTSLAAFIVAIAHQMRAVLEG